MTVESVTELYQNALRRGLNPISRTIYADVKVAYKTSAQNLYFSPILVDSEDG